jgi:predicted nuclease of restriction endonuclease-like (RecB) superfamily
MNFKLLSNQILQANSLLQNSAVNAVNKHITFRNWIIGYYIFEYEQKGEDRAKYGDKLLQKLEVQFKKKNLKGLNESNLYRFKNFYITYPSISATVSQEFKEKSLNLPIPATVSQEFNSTPASVSGISIFENSKKHTAHYSKLFAQTSFSHFTELIKIAEPTKRAYYELLILNTHPSVRELRRAIDTLSFERTGLSKNKKLSFETIAKKIKPIKPADAIKDFYFFDFLDLSGVDVVDESQLETALLNHLEKFILELGNGFCFEARQKRILIGDEYFFIDMVFYHRILKCHVIVELKVDSFNHSYVSQLNTYLKYYNKEVKLKTDSSAIGILLVADKNKTLVEYALDGMDEKMFVSKYAVELPTKKQFENFIKQQLRSL